MRKIFYAAGNRSGSSLQYHRFLSSIVGKNIELKTAAYKISMMNASADYTLDSLLRFTNQGGDVSFNGNFTYLSNEIKRFAPDIIISDMDIFSSLIAISLGIELWQASPLLLYWALSSAAKKKIKMHSGNEYILGFGSFRNKQMLDHIVNNSDAKIVVSHFGDLEEPPGLKDGFIWARPDFILTTGSASVNTEFRPNINTSDYELQLSLCSSAVLPGYEHFTADAFYNEIPYSFAIDKTDSEAILSGAMDNHYNNHNILLNDKINFLSEII